jgi:hypothetical protein
LSAPFTKKEPNYEAAMGRYGPRARAYLPRQFQSYCLFNLNVEQLLKNAYSQNYTYLKSSSKAPVSFIGVR